MRKESMKEQLMKEQLMKEQNEYLQVREVQEDETSLTAARQRGDAYLDRCHIATKAAVKVYYYLLNRDPDLTNWKSTIFGRDKEDHLQQLYLILIQRLSRVADKLEEEGTASVRREQVVHLHTDDTAGLTYIDVRTVQLDVPVDQLQFLEWFRLLYRPIKSSFLWYLSRLVSSHQQASLDAVAESDDWRVDEGPTLIDRLHDRAAAVEMTTTDYVQSLRGTLSRAEYEYIMTWMTDGRQPHRCTRTRRRIVAKLRAAAIEEGWSPDELREAIDAEVYRRRLMKAKAEATLHRVTAI